MSFAPRAHSACVTLSHQVAEYIPNLPIHSKINCLFLTLPPCSTSLSKELIGSLDSIIAVSSPRCSSERVLVLWKVDIGLLKASHYLLLTLFKVKITNGSEKYYSPHLVGQSADPSCQYSWVAQRLYVLDLLELSSELMQYPRRCARNG